MANTHSIQDNRRKYEINDDRCDVVIDATYEIEQLCELAMEQATRSNSEDAVVFRGLAARVHQLNGVIMSAIGEQGYPLEKLHKELHGHLLSKQVA